MPGADLCVIDLVQVNDSRLFGAKNIVPNTYTKSNGPIETQFGGIYI